MTSFRPKLRTKAKPHDQEYIQHDLLATSASRGASSVSVGCRPPTERFLWYLLKCVGYTLFSRCNIVLQIRKHTHTHTPLCPGLLGWAGTRKVWILLKQETVSGSGISWAICKSAPSSRQITMPAPHHSIFLQAGCPSCRPTNILWHEIVNGMLE